MSKYGVISGPYFPVFGLNTEIYGPEITPYLDTFHAVKSKVGNSRVFLLLFLIFFFRCIFFLSVFFFFFKNLMSRGTRLCTEPNKWIENLGRGQLLTFNVYVSQLLTFNVYI